METGCKTWNACSAGSTQSKDLKSVKQLVESAVNTWVLKGQKSVLFTRKHLEKPWKILVSQRKLCLVL